jgi:hypothetical protein
MENSRRSKKRSKFFWPEIGLLILGLLGFKPELLYNIFGASNQSSYATTRPVNQQPHANQPPLTSNSLLAWGVQAIQSAASQTMSGLPVATQPHGQPLPTQQQYYPHYTAAQYPPYQQPMNYIDYGYSPYQAAPASSGYASPNSHWAATNNGNFFVPTAAANYPGSSASNRVPPAEYQNTPASFPNQAAPTAPFPSTNASGQSNAAPYGNIYGNNVRKEGTEYADPRLSSAPYNPAPYGPNLYGQPPYPTAGTTQTPAYSNLPNQTASTMQGQYYWGAVDPRVNNSQRTGSQNTGSQNTGSQNTGSQNTGSQRLGTQGSWVPNVPAWTQGTGQAGRY